MGDMKLRYKFTSVGELAAYLATLDPGTPLYTSGADIGGYDVSDCGYAVVQPYKDGVRITHQEYIAYELYEKGEITYEEATLHGS